MVTVFKDADPQNSLTLDASQAQPGLTLDGQQVPYADQIASATSGNNFINFCLTRTDLVSLLSLSFPYHPLRYLSTTKGDELAAGE